MQDLETLSPQKLKKLTNREKEQLAKDIRNFLIESLSKTGGHLSSNLGIVELSIAMHSVFDVPEDKFVFDVGHQCYVHKIITGRAKNFSTLRQYKGLSGFMQMSESEYDQWEAGHAGTSISGAVGFAVARDVNREKNHVVAMVGDGSVTNGMIFEALNHIAELNLKIIIIINDNEMSISKNIGFVNKMFTALDTSETYGKTKSSIRKTIYQIPKGYKINRSISKIKKKVKNFEGGPRELFTAMGLNYVGIIDGHNIEDMEKVLKKAKQSNGPTVIHVKTIKGKGYEFSEKCVTGRWHGVGKFNPKTGEVETSNKESYSLGVAKIINKEMEKNKNLVVITPAMLKGSELEIIKQNHPKRIYDVGIAEEHAITMAAGMGLTKVKPIVTIYSTFLQRGYDQVLHDVAKQKSNVLFIVDRSGITGSDGDTHQGLFDISFLNAIPNVVITMGKDINETESLIKIGIEHKGPFVVRLPKDSIENDITENECPAIEFGKWEVIKEGKDGCIISFGKNLEDALLAIKNSEKNLKLINARFIKPLDIEIPKNEFKKNQKILVIEEGIEAGGFGSMVIVEAQKQNSLADVKILAINDSFVAHGTPEELKHEFKIDSDGILAEIKKIF